MEKFCVFCGNKPESKNKEHIIPIWLIENTGNPKRKALFGFDFTAENPKLRNYSFDSFVFPACEKCNTNFAKLEGTVKYIIDSILEEKALNSLDIMILMDWLDKIRVGLWLSFYYLNKNYSEISPKFHINSRIGMRDRFLVIYKVDTDRIGINFFGPDIPTFQNNPTCFALLINNYCFFNGSCINLCDRRLGFPYSKESFYKNLKEIDVNIVPGFNRKFFPIIRKSFIPNGTKFYQPIFTEWINNEKIKNLYDNQYVKTNSIYWESGKGKIFQEINGIIKDYPFDQTMQWKPIYSHELSSFLFEINKSIFNFQNYFFNISGSIEKLNQEEKSYIKKEMEISKILNKKYLNILKENINRVFS